MKINLDTFSIRTPSQIFSQQREHPLIFLHIMSATNDSSQMHSAKAWV